MNKRQRIKQIKNRYKYGAHKEVFPVAVKASTPITMSENSITSYDIVIEKNDIITPAARYLFQIIVPLPKPQKKQKRRIVITKNKQR